MDTLDNSRPEIVTCSFNKRESSLKEFFWSDEWAPLWVVRENCFILKHQHWSGNLQGSECCASS